MEGLFNDVASSNEVDPLDLSNVQFESTRNSLINSVSENVANDENADALSEQNLVQNNVIAEVNKTSNENNNTVHETDSNHRGTSSNEADLENEHQIEQNLQEVLQYGTKCVVDSDLEYIYIPNKTLKPIECSPEYEVKANDVLCGNIPFKQFVSSK